MIFRVALAATPRPVRFYRVSRADGILTVVHVNAATAATFENGKMADVPGADDLFLEWAVGQADAEFVFLNGRVITLLRDVAHS